MPSRTLPGIGLQAEWALGENGWKAGMDGNLRMLSTFVNMALNSIVDTLPGAPADGDTHIIASGENADKIALRDQGQWILFTPLPGFRGFVKSVGRTYVYDGTDWLREQSDGIVEMTVSGGTENAVQVTVPPGLDVAATKLFYVDVENTNTGNVTIAINGGAPLPAFNVRDENFAVGEFGGRIFLTNEGTSLRALNEASAALAASTAAAAAVGAYADFSKRYMGAKAADPVLDNAGNALEEGASYFSTTLGILRYYHSGAFVSQTTTLVDGDVTETKLSTALIQSLGKVCYSVAEMQALDTTRTKVAYLAVAGKEGMFVWDGSDLNSKFVRVSLDASVLDSTDTINMLGFTTTAVNVSTKKLTAPVGITLTELDEVTVTTSVNGFVVNARYFVRNWDLATRTFELRTSRGAGFSAGAAPIGTTTNFGITKVHRLFTGYAVTPNISGHGLTVGNFYYVIRDNPRTFRLADTPDLARAGTARALSTDGAITIRHLIDPLMGMMIPKTTGGSVFGYNGAWVREDKIANSKYFGAKGDNTTDDWYALQCSLWAGNWLDTTTYTPSGRYRITRGLLYETNDWLYNDTIRQASLNGVLWDGDGRERTRIIPDVSVWTSEGWMLTYDANPWALQGVVGSRSMQQGSSRIQGIGFGGSDPDSVTKINGIRVRGIWDMTWDDLDIYEISGDAISCFSGAVVNPGDEVDNVAFWTINNTRLQRLGRSGFVGTAARLGNIRFEKCIIEDIFTYGVTGCFAYSTFKNCVFTRCGNRADTTSGAMRLVDADTGSQSRTNLIETCTFEQNVNQDIDILMMRGGRIANCSFHTMGVAGGPVADKANIKLRNGGTGKNHNIEIDGCRFPAHGAGYDIPNIDVQSGVEMPTIRNIVSDMYATNTVVRLQSPKYAALERWNPAYDAGLVLTGAAPVGSTKNGAPL